MDIRIESVERFRRAFDAVAAVIPGRSPKPVVMCALIHADADGVSIVGTNLETAITVAIDEGIDLIRSGHVLIPAARLRAILRASKGAGGLTIRAEAGRAFIDADGSEVRLATEDPAHFPAVDIPAPTSGYHVAAGDLKRLIKQTVFVTGDDQKGFVLGGVMLERDLLMLNAVAADGRRLAVSSAMLEPFGAEPPAIRPIVPGAAMAKLGALLADAPDDHPVAIGYGDRTAVFAWGGARFLARLLEGRFPPYRDIFPARCATSARVNAGPLRSAVALAATVTAEESRGVDFDLSDDGATLKARAADVGDSEVSLETEHKGPGQAFCLDHQYVSQALGVLEPESAVTIEVGTEKEPIVFRAEGFDYIAMPLVRG